MTTPKVAKDFFAEAQADFTPVVGTPNDNDVKCLNEAFINALQSINVPGGAIDLSGILITDEEHKSKHGEATRRLDVRAHGGSPPSLQRQHCLRRQ